jgi:Bacterial SH3 domain
MTEPSGNSVWIWIAAGVVVFVISVAGVLFGLSRLDQQEEEARYWAAQNDIDGLNSYLRTCRHCQFRDEAERRLHQLFAAEIRSVGFDRGKIAKSLTLCGLSCPGELRQEAHRRLDVLDAERTQYEATSDDIGRLDAYVRDCKGCEFIYDAELRLSELRKGPLVATSTPTIDVKETRTIPDPLPELPDPDVEYQKAVSLDSIEGYAAFLEEFPNYPKNSTIRPFVKRWQQDTLGKQTEQAQSTGETKKSCEHLLFFDPQGVYAERASHCLVATASSPQPQEFDSCYFVTGLGGKRLALRSEPSFQGRQSNHMAPNTKLTLLERNGEWMHVRLQSGETGWANARYLETCHSRTIPGAFN